MLVEIGLSNVRLSVLVVVVAAVVLAVSLPVVVHFRTLDVTGCWRLTDDGFVNLLQVYLHVIRETLT